MIARQIRAVFSNQAISMLLILIAMWFVLSLLVSLFFYGWQYIGNHSANGGDRHHCSGRDLNYHFWRDRPFGGLDLCLFRRAWEDWYYKRMPTCRRHFSPRSSSEESWGF